MTKDDFLALKNHECAASRWVLIDQARINKFAAATEDHQFIHVDPARAKATPFGGTIAHGALVLSLLAGLAPEIMPAVESTSMGVNFGFDRIRFLTPVLCGAEVRARLTITAVTERAPNVLQANMQAVMEINGAPKPALVAAWMTLTYVE